MLDRAQLLKSGGASASNPREFLKRQMMLHGVSGPELAVELDVHSQTIYNVTSGKRPISSKLAIKLAAKFGEPIEFWLGERIAVPVTPVVPAPETVARAPAQPTPPAASEAAFQPGVLVDEDYRTLVNHKGSGLSIRPYFGHNVSPASYDLTIGIVVTKGFSKLDKYDWGLIVKYVCNADTLQEDEFEEAKELIKEYEKDITYEETFKLLPLAPVGIVLREELKFSGDFLARVGGTTKNAVRGLVVNHGLQVDPGYSGPILMTAFNIGLEPIELNTGENILSLEVVRLRRAPANPYHEDTNSKIARIVERLGTEIADLFDYEPIPHEHLHNAVLRLNPDESFVGGRTLEEARSLAVARVIEKLEDDGLANPFAFPFQRVLGQVTIALVDAEALIRRFPACSEEARSHARAAFDHRRERRTLKDILKKLDLKPHLAVPKLMSVTIEANDAAD